MPSSESIEPTLTIEPLPHRLPHRAHPEVGSDRVDFEHATQDVLAGVRDRAEVQHRGVVHQHVDAPAPRERVPDHARPVLAGGDVMGLEARGVADLAGDRAALVAQDVAEHDLRALRHQAPRDRSARAARRSGHDRHSALERAHRFIPSTGRGPYLPALRSARRGRGSLGPLVIPFIDTLDPAYDEDIHAAHAAAREKSWYAETPTGLLVLRYRDVQAVLRDPRWRELGRDALRLAGIADGPLWEWFGQIMSTQEGAAHARLRRLVSQAFTPRSVERLRPVMRRTAHELLDRFVDAGRCELVGAFAAPYPVRVIGALLGVPAGDFEQFHAWSSDLSLAFGSQVTAWRSRIEAALTSLSGYVDELLALRRRRPEDDLISSLIAAEERGDRLSPEELRAMVTVLIFGGQDTTQCQIACAIAAFLRHPEAWRRLARDPGLAADATEEVLRYESAGSGSPRIAGEAGTVALPSSPAANRDPEVYPEPDRFDIDRRHAEPQLAFGGGVHYCLGASLARAELQEALPILARRLPDLASDGPTEWRHGSLIRGPERLPIAFSPGIRT
jgi:cytochrome P450